MSAIAPLQPQADAAALPTGLQAAVQSLHRAAMAVAQPGGPGLFAHLIEELAESLNVAVAFVAVFEDESRLRMRTLAAWLDGRVLKNFDYALAGTPCARVVGNRFRHVERGVAAEFPAGSLFGAKGMDSYAAYPLSDSAGTPLGLLVAMDRKPIADAELAEALLKIYAVRMAAEIERGVADEALRGAALAVSSAHGASVFDELVRCLATILHVDMALIALLEEGEPPTQLHAIALQLDGRALAGTRYPLAGTACASVLAGGFQAYASGVGQLFPHGDPAWDLGLQSYAGYPLADHAGRTIGLVAVAARRPLASLERIAPMLQIFAVRAGAELERQRAEQALALREEQYRALFEAASDAFILRDAQMRVVDVNPAFLRMSGFTREHLASASGYPPNFPPEHVAERLGMVRRALAGEAVHAEVSLLRGDGSGFDADVRVIPVRYRGEPHVLSIVRDISERKAAERALRLREEQYRAIFDGSADALLLWSRELLIVDVNPAFTQLYGYARDEVIGRGFQALLPPAEVARRVALIRRALLGEEGQLETIALSKTGAAFEVELRYLPIVYRGEPHVLAVTRDFTERRQREHALERSEARLRATVEAAFDCVFGMDGEGRIVEFNAAAERCFGYRREDVLGRPLAEVVIPPHQRAAHTRGLENFHKTGQGPFIGRLIETTAMRADGSEFPVELAISVAAVHEGSIFVGHLRDISARRRAEEQRGELEAQLRQAQKMEAIGQLTGGIAHDFNNILTSVIGYVVLASERAESSGDAHLVRQLGQAHIAAQRARDLIAQMLSFARRQRGQRHVLAPAPLVRQAVQLLRATLPSSIELDNLQSEADAEQATPAIEADAVQLEQVLFNLCINARDAISGSGRIGVRLAASAGEGWHCASCRSRIDGGRWVQISVSDNGSGIAPEVLERMFDPFFSTKEVGQGSGMGLAMAHGIVHDHGGHIRVETKAGSGSTFHVMLPPAHGPMPAAGAASAAGAARAAATPLRGRVLVVEDQPLVGDFMAELLQSWGLDVVLQRDPLAAEAWLGDSKEPLQLMITDQTMPRLTGLELAGRAVALRPGLPVLLYTGDASEFSATELQRSGVQAVLRKPIAVDELKGLLRRLLGAPPATTA